MNASRWVPLLWFAVLDMVLAGVIAYLFAPREPIVLFGVSLAVLWILPFLTSTWNYAKYWLAYVATGKRLVVRNIKADFYKNKFPAGLAYFDPDEYLRGVMSNDDIDLSVRYRAAYLLGEKSAIRTLRPMTEGMAIHLAYCQALEEYRP